MKRWLSCLLLLLCALPGVAATNPEETVSSLQRVYILPIRDDIMPPLVYLVRRGVKEAMEAKADLLLLDMDTNGGRVDSTEEIIEILAQFKGQTVTYVNRKAYSAGAFISVATQKIYMGPESVIGAAAPIMMSPGGMGVEDMPNTIEVKMTSAISAKIRAYAEKNGHNTQVVEAMIDKQKELNIDGKVLNEKGKILTLTNREAERKYGDPAKPLLSLGTVENLDELLRTLGFAGAARAEIKPTGAEKLATWINALNWLWLIIGAAGIYIEFKTPGFGLPGIVGISAIALYFLGGYIAGLSGLEWLALFVLGLVLVALELFLFPGTIVLGLAGTLLMIFTIIMSLVDHYPGMPAVPSLPQLHLPLQTLAISLVGTIVVILTLGRFLPKTPIYQVLVTQSVSAMKTVEAQEQRSQQLLGREGVAISLLRPGGKAQFGDDIVDVVTEGPLVEKGTRVKVIGASGREAIVAPIV